MRFKWFFPHTIWQSRQHFIFFVRARWNNWVYYDQTHTPHSNKNPINLCNCYQPPAYSTLCIAHFLLKRHWCWKYHPIFFAFISSSRVLRPMILIKCLWFGFIRTPGCDPLQSIQTSIPRRRRAKSRQKDVGKWESLAWGADFFWGGVERVGRVILRCEGNYMSDGSACCKTSGLSDHEIRWRAVRKLLSTFGGWWITREWIEH